MAACRNWYVLKGDEITEIFVDDDSEFETYVGYIVTLTVIINLFWFSVLAAKCLFPMQTFKEGFIV